MQITRLTDFIYAYRLLNLIQKSWAEQEAYKHGIIDSDGKLLRRYSELKTAEERNSFTYFHRIAFNLKRLLDKIPGMEGSKPMRIAAALRMLKEDNELDQPFTDAEIQFIGQKLLGEETPTNVTGAAAGLPVDKPLKATAKPVRRKAPEVTAKVT